MSSITKRQILALYKALLRESTKFPAYNFRMYALRKTRDEFKQNSIVTDANSLSKLYSEGLKSLESLKRQVIVGQLYSTDKLVIEKLAL